MTADRTQQQSNQEQRDAQELSRQRTRPPAEVTGYEAKQFIGAGAYGEVWIGVDRNTGRRVAIKYYTHGGGVDWSLLSREVEKLVFLSADRYVVQLLDVGWDSDPPYYVMEYIENGSLDDRLRQEGPLPVSEAVDVFRELAVGLLHAHGKGVLHCDLKPANVLLDQDNKPRLADFGQSRLSHEQMPALGTLFYMAPEQADLEAVPDARWDVYALGALLVCMLTGRPPHRNDQFVEEVDSTTDLGQRLIKYRTMISGASLATGHRTVPDIDRALIEIIDRCLAVDPDHRFPNVQGIIDALDARAEARARRPLVMLGFVGPLLLLLVMGLFAWRGYAEAVGESDQAVTAQALGSNLFAAKYVAGAVSHEIDRYFRTVEHFAEDPQFLSLLEQVVDHDELGPLLVQLSDPSREEDVLPTDRFKNHPSRIRIEKFLAELITDPRQPKAASWFVTSAQGTHIASVFDSPAQSPVGKNYSWRTYYHGGPADLPRNQRPDHHIGQTHLSAVFQSTATFAWKVAISTPIYQEDRFLGILAMTVEMGSFVTFEGSDTQFAVLVAGREGQNRGVILQHPLFDRVLRQHDKLPAKFSQYVVPLEDWSGDAVADYQDPLSEAEPEGNSFRKDWLAARATVQLKRTGTATADVDTGLIVLVQEEKDFTIKPVHDLGRRLVREGVTALSVVIVVVVGLWYFVIRGLGSAGRARAAPVDPSTATSLSSVVTEHAGR